MPEITRAATLDDSADLLARVPHANLAFATPAGIDATPVAFRYFDGHYWIGLPRGEETPTLGTHAMLLIDDGVFYFDLRGVRVRGTLRDAATPPALDNRLRWLDLEPLKINAWHYGSMRPRENP